jgi:D-glycero-alpha-D-manno-heptose-7-phosphate kinase
MIISRTPFRISFFGGGTDYPAWFQEHGGAVLSTSFDKYSYITCRELPPFFEHKYRIAYSKVENANDIKDIQHPAIRAVLEELNHHSGLEIHCDADLPARSGLGSSSSFVVGLLHSLTALQGKRVSSEWLAAEAIRIEQEVLCENVGSQDQAAAAHGGLNLIHFQQNGNLRLEPLILTAARKREFNDHLMLFFTGFSRISSEIAKAHVKNMEKNSTELHRMRAMVDQAVDILCSDRAISAIGELLHIGWMYKRSMSDQVSNPSIDSLYDRARRAGAIGGKLLGAGGGGFMLMFAAPENQEKIKSELKELIHVPFKFENSGSQVIYYQP